MAKKISYRYTPSSFLSVVKSKPQAIAELHGSAAFPQISGTVRFYTVPEGTVLYVKIKDLPGENRIFGFHIHEGTACSGDADDPFSGALSHYDPGSDPHPYHAGDLPSLFGNNGLALTLFLTDRFTVEEVIGKTIIIHDRPDDFTTQPSGGSGTKIACGIIK